MPVIGPFFFGPDPGPCSSVDTSTSQGTTTYVYEEGKLVSDSSQIGSLTTYQLDAQGRIGSYTTGGTTDVFEYGSDYLLDTMTSSDSSNGKRLRYSLSTTGYPLTAVLTFPNGMVQNLRYDYSSCRLVTRVLTDVATGSTSELDYTYDGVGHLISRIDPTGSIDGDTYNYACWQ